MARELLSVLVWLVTVVAAAAAFVVTTKYLTAVRRLPEVNNLVVYGDVVPHVGIGKLFSGGIYSFAVLFVATWVLLSAAAGRATQISLLEALRKPPYAFLPLVPLLAIPPKSFAWTGVGHNVLAWLLVVALSLGLAAATVQLGPRRRPTASAGPSRLGGRLVYAGVAGYAAVFSALAILKYESQNTFTFDLAQFDQILWNTVRGRLLASSFLHRNYLIDHFSPILLPLSGLYLLWPDVRALLVFQSLFLALGAIPLYWIAKSRIEEPLLQVAVPLSYLLFLPLHGVNLEDFHEIALAPTLLLLAWHFLERGHTTGFVVSLALAATTKEEVLLIAATIGAYLALRDDRKRLGAWVLVVSLAAFGAYMVLRHLVPRVVLGIDYEFPFSRYFPVKEILAHPLGTFRYLFGGPLLALKLQMLLFLFAPVMFLPFASTSRALIMVVPLGGMLASHFLYMYVPTTHYSASLIPLVFVLTVSGAAGLAERYRGVVSPAVLLRFCGSYLIACAVLANYFFGQLPFSRAFPAQTYSVSERNRLVHRFQAMIPDTASLSVGVWPSPHFSQRERLYGFSYGDLGVADYVLLDLDKHKPWERTGVFRAIAQGDYGVVACAEGITLLQRSQPNDAACLAAIERKLDVHWRRASLEVRGPAAPDAAQSVARSPLM